MNQKLFRVVREKELAQYSGLKKSATYELIKKGEFPKPIKLSDTGRAVAWLEADLICWQAQRIAKSRASSR